MKNNIKKAAVAVLACSFVLGACSPKGGEEKGKKGGKEKHLVVANQVGVKELDPHKDWNAWTLYRLGGIETLFKLDKDMNITPSIAKGYKNIDPKNWEVELREDVKFSNGEKVTAKKIIESLKRSIELNPSLAELKGTEFKDEGNKIVITTKEPNATLINNLCDPFTSIIDVENTKDFKNKPIATGPYKIESFAPDMEVKLVKNENYSGEEKPKLDSVTEKVIKESSTMVNALKSGEVNAAINISFEGVKELKGTQDFNIEQRLSSRGYFAYFHENIMKQKGLGQAITAAINKETIAKDLLLHTVTATVTPLPKGYGFGEESVKGQTFNLADVEKILTDMGYKKGAKYFEKDGKTLDLKQMFYPRLSMKSISLELQSQMQKAGINATANEIATWEYLKRGEYEMGMYASIMLPTGDPYTFLERTFGTGGSANYNKYSNKEVDGKLKALKQEFDINKRKELVKEIQQLIVNDYAHVFIGHTMINTVSKKNIKNLNLTPQEYTFLDAKIDME